MNLIAGIVIILLIAVIVFLLWGIGVIMTGIIEKTTGR